MEKRQTYRLQIMAKDKKSFVAYCDWIDSFEELSDEEAGRLVKHLFRYVNDKNPEAPDKLTKMCFIPIQQSLKRDLKKYEAYVQKQSENGSKGGRPQKPKEPKKPNALFENPSEPKKADSVSVSVNVSANDNEDSKNYLIEPDLFETFWQLYKKGSSRVAAQKEWFEIDEREYPKIIEHVPKYVESTPDVKFRKDAVNYLKNRAWLDTELPRSESAIKPNLSVSQMTRIQKIEYCAEKGIRQGSAEYNKIVNNVLI